MKKTSQRAVKKYSSLKHCRNVKFSTFCLVTSDPETIHFKNDFSSIFLSYDSEEKIPFIFILCHVMNDQTRTNFLSFKYP